MGKAFWMYPIVKKADITTALKHIKTHNSTPVVRTGSYTFEEYQALDPLRAGLLQMLRAIPSMPLTYICGGESWAISRNGCEVATYIWSATYAPVMARSGSR
jgi:hypothetical protein